MTTAFVLSGGASLGAVQVGALQALAERGITPDLLVGTSVGALNAAYVSGHGCTPASIRSLATLWQGLNSRDVFTIDRRLALKALVGLRNSICSDKGLRALIEDSLVFDELEDAQIPLTVVAAVLRTGQEMPLRTGSARRALLASCAIPGIFPPVPHGEHLLVDGGLANDTAISQAVLAGADTVYVLPVGYPCGLLEAPRTALGSLAHALTLLMHQRVVSDVRLYAAEVNLVVLPPPCPITVSAADFSHAPELITTAHAAASAALDTMSRSPGDPAALIAVHTHGAQS